MAIAVEVEEQVVFHIDAGQYSDIINSVKEDKIWQFHQDKD
jgi:hypothetical protein